MKDRENGKHMPQDSPNYLVRANEYWQSGRSTEAGRLIFENLSPQVRPKWASRILALMTERTGIKSPPIERVLQIAGDPGKWGTAHDASSVARRAAIELVKLRSRTADQDLLLGLTSLAGLVARVIYNSTGSPDPFDDDTGWSLVESVRRVLDLLKDDQFSDSIWFALCHEGNLNPSQ